MSVDLTFVIDHLAIGARLPPTPGPLLADLGVRAVVDLRAEEKDDEEHLAAHGIALLHLPTPDEQASDPSLLARGVHWVRQNLSRPVRVVVHCQHGIGRSSLLVLCVLVSRGEAPLGALERCKALRPKVALSPPQVEAFRAFCATAGAPVPAVHEVTAITWRPRPPG